MEAAVTEDGPWSHQGKKTGGHRVEWPGDYDTPPFQGSPHQSPDTTVPKAGATWLDFLLCVVFRVTGRTLDILQSRKQEVKKGHVPSRNTWAPGTGTCAAGMPNPRYEGISHHHFASHSPENPSSHHSNGCS